MKIVGWIPGIACVILGIINIGFALYGPNLSLRYINGIVGIVGIKVGIIAISLAKSME